MKKRFLSMILVAALLVSMLPVTAFAAHDSTGKPLDLTGDVYLALYIGGSDFPGEPAEHAVSGYLNLNGSFGSNGFGKFAESAENILDQDILADVVQGTSGVWGVFSTTGGSRYLLPSSGLVNESSDAAHKPHNAETEKKIIQTAINNGYFSLGNGESIEDYTIVWYVIKYQRSDSAWHIDGLITKKSTYSVNYYGNGNTSGGAPTGESGLSNGDTHIVLGNTGGLRKVVGRDTYIFNGWNTSASGNGTHYDAGDEITIDNANVTLYAEWYLQNRYTATVVTKLNDVETNVENILGDGVTLYLEMQNNGHGSGEYISLDKTTAGTYTTTVTENGAYHIWAEDASGKMEKIEGYQVTIYNQNGGAELQYYSVNYDTNAGTDTVTWDGEAAPSTTVYPVATPITAVSGTPVREGYTFLYWLDQDNKKIMPGQQVTDGITEKTVLTAQWDKNINVTVDVIVDHKGGAGYNNSANREEVLLQFLREENGVNLPLDQVLLDPSHDSHAFDEQNMVTTYSMTATNVTPGVYKVTVEKQMYDIQITRTEEPNGDQRIVITLTYAPESFDLSFDVVVKDATKEGNRELLPDAVNVKVLYWGYNSNRELGWHVITQQLDGGAPTTVYIDPQTGTGTGSFTVWKYWDSKELEGNHAYEYRIEVSSFVMPDGNVIPASGNLVTYTPNGSGLYTATITTEDGGRKPTMPEADNLDGAYFDGTVQNGVPTATITIKPFIVEFDAAGDGTLNGQDVVTLSHQYKYPDLSEYIPVPLDKNLTFVGWYYADANNNYKPIAPAENLAGQYLTDDVFYVAVYSVDITVQGRIEVVGKYDLNGNPVAIKEVDRVKNVMVVLQKLVNGQYMDVASYEATITYGELGTEGFGDYNFPNLPPDGSEYRIQVLARNYDATYDNESDGSVSYSPEEWLAVLDGDAIATILVHLDHAPESYVQQMEVDASQISEGFRPSNTLAEILYRDVGDIHHYDVISQHTIAPFGKEIPLSAAGFGSGSDSVWQYHTDGTLYEYQMNITTIYGNVKGFFVPEGTPYNSDTAPFSIEYTPAAHFSAADGGQSHTLKATLIPKEYEIIFDLGLDEGETVYGMDAYLTDSLTGDDYYSYLHTWSYGDTITAFPYRPGYIFECWESPSRDVVVGDDGGTITVGAGVAETVTLKAKWTKLEGTTFTVRYLELNTEKPLRGAYIQTSAIAGSTIKAVDYHENIDGYTYAGAMVNGKMYTSTEDVALTITNDAQKNILTLYYVKEGYSEQVESNLKLDKTATLENNGTYTINLETYTMDNPVTTMILQNTPLDIVLVLDQSGSLAENNKAGLLALQGAVDTFVEAIANHGRHNEVDHRIALVGYASNQTDGTTSTNSSQNPYSGGVVSSRWTNTGVFDSNGEFHLYDIVKGFNYSRYNGSVTANGVYYTYAEPHNAYLLLTYHEQYYHLITEEQARVSVLEGTQVYGYVYDDKDIGSFVKLERNSSGLWLYGEKQLYSAKEFFTYHTDVWTHRHNLETREIHAYGTGSNYREIDGHTGVYTRTETGSTTHQLSVYEDALIPVSVGANGSGSTNPGLIKATQGLGANGATRASLGMDMANQIFEANPHDGDRVRVVVMFTDGNPGQSGFLESEANDTIAKAYTAKHEYDAYVYTIGLYTSDGVDSHSNVAVYMNAVSSNYPDAKTMDDVMIEEDYITPPNGSKLGDGNTYYVKDKENYYPVKYGTVKNKKCWYYTDQRGKDQSFSTESNPTIRNGKVGTKTIVIYQPGGYAQTPYSGYYTTTDSENKLSSYFANVMTEITTNITTEIVLHGDTILRDIMGQGLVLTPNSVITAYKVAGSLNTTTNQVEWSDKKEQVAQILMQGKTDATIYSDETTDISFTNDDGSVTTRKNVPYISVYNYSPNVSTTNADHPHTIDITGYDFENNYIKEGHDGYKMVIEITSVEARDDVQWGRSTATNHERSGMWLPADENGNRQLLMAFDQPTTIFVERAFVLDYGKEFVLSDWYFDDNAQNNQDATPIHLDLNIADGMNRFDVAQPNRQNTKDGEFGNTKYGNVKLDPETGKVTYSPASMNWGGYDQFYVFGNTWRKTVLAQSANENGNLWNKVTVIPANNIYYEDSFITKPSEDGGNDIAGFQFTGDWEIVYDNGEANAGQNVEHPEHLESAPYGDVHGWTNSLGDDKKFTDGSAHAAGLESLTNRLGATAKFTFTGTGVDVFSRTNINSGLLIALLYQHVPGSGGTETLQLSQVLTMDNLAVSGDYYHIPTISFNVPYGTYTMELVATMASNAATGQFRYEYYLDGVRIYNPLGNTTAYQPDNIKAAYGLENNAVFTEVRDILLDYGDFMVDMDSGTDEKLGAVFIDWIREGQGTGSDTAGTGEATYEIGTFESLGPKNEVYLNAGQAIVLKVAEGNTYYVGMKSLTGENMKVNVSGIDMKKTPVTIEIAHATDMYYRVNPVDGYIVIQNAETEEGKILSITNLRTTNAKEPAKNGGVQGVSSNLAVETMRTFALRIEKQDEVSLPDETTQEPVNELLQQQVDQTVATASSLFVSVRQWLEID